MEAIKITGSVLALNYLAHYVSGYSYDWFCMPHSIYDFIPSLVTTASPVCSTLLTVMSSTQQNYSTIIVTTLSVGVSRWLKPNVESK